MRSPAAFCGWSLSYQPSSVASSVQPRGRDKAELATDDRNALWERRQAVTGESVVALRAFELEPEMENSPVAKAVACDLGP